MYRNSTASQLSHRSRGRNPRLLILAASWLILVEPCVASAQTDSSAPSASSDRLIVLANVARAQSAEVSIRIRDATVRQFTLQVGDRETVTVPASADVQFYCGDRSEGEAGWLTIKLDGVREVEFETIMSGTRRVWTTRSFARTVLPNSIGMSLVPILPGTCRMGSRWTAAQVARHFTSPGFREDVENFRSEHPRHRVRISKPFYMSRHEVTNAQFATFIADTNYRTDPDRLNSGGGTANPNAAEREEQRTGPRTWRESQDGWRAPEGGPNGITADDVPVVNVSWNDAVAFCEWLSEREGRRYRLPTEAEWEYACRAGTETMYWMGDRTSLLADVANVPDQSLARSYRESGQRLDYEVLETDDGFAGTAPVGSFRANPFGLYDVHGNVWEWCQDSYDANYYNRSPVVDPVCRTATLYRIVRGGCFL